MPRTICASATNGSSEELEFNMIDLGNPSFKRSSLITINELVLG